MTLKYECDLVRIGGGAAVTDLLGIPPTGLRRRPPATLGNVVSMSLITDVPGNGRMTFRIQVDGDVVTSRRSERVAAVALEAPYQSILDWLHGDALLGHLLIDGALADGDLLVLSAIEGVVSAPRVEPTAEVQEIIRLLRCRDDR